MNQAIRQLIRSDDIRHDPWGTALQHHFGICGALYLRGEHIPDEWQFSPGLALTQYDDYRMVPDDGVIEYPDVEYLRLLDDDDVTADDLRTAGRVLSRYVDYCDRIGRSY